MGQKMAEKPNIALPCESSRIVDIMAVSPCPRPADFLWQLQTFGQGRWLATLSDAGGVQLLLIEVVGEPEVGAHEVGVHEVGVREVGVHEVGVREVGVREAGAHEVGAREDGAREVGAHEVGAREVGAREVGAREVGAGELPPPPDRPRAPSLPE